MVTEIETDRVPHLRWSYPCRVLYHKSLLYKVISARCLSWETILRKREAYRRAFSRFDQSAVARFNDRDRQRLLADAGIVRNRLKIDSAIRNAAAFLKVQEECGSFDA